MEEEAKINRSGELERRSVYKVEWEKKDQANKQPAKITDNKEEL
jgi:hypothetical protein